MALRSSTCRLLLNACGVLALSFTMGCNNSGVNEASGKSAAATKITDAEILGVLSAVNRGEVKAAELAQERSITPAVDELAQHVIATHSQAQEKVLAVKALEPSTSGLSRSLEEQGTAEMAKLQGLAGAEFDRAYADSQARMHQQVLETIDSTLMPQSQSDEVRAVLEALRPQVADDLARVQQLDSTGAAAGAGAP
jgi:putative membrane protein